MKSKRKICILAMREAFRRVFGTDAPAVVVLACEVPKTKREVERVYEEIMRERDSRRADEQILERLGEQQQFDDGGEPYPF